MIDAVITAQQTANTAASAASHAQGSANNAQSTANAALPKSGGTMTGPITGIQTPTVDTGAANKQYVDSSIVRPNLIDNHLFTRMINQRGKSSYTGANRYGYDRWKLFGNLTATADNTGLTLTGDAVSTDGIGQIKLADEFVNGTYTFSVLTADNELVFKTVNITGDPLSTTVPLSNGNIKMHYKPNITGLSDKIIFGIYTTLKLLAIKFEIGSTQTLAHKKGDTWVLNEIPDYATELLKCQRYLLYGPIEATNQTGTYSLLPTPIRMRAKPSILGTPKVYTVATNRLVDQATVSVTSVINNCVILRATGTTEQCYIAFTSEAGLTAEL